MIERINRQRALCQIIMCIKSNFVGRRLSFTFNKLVQKIDSAKYYLRHRQECARKVERKTKTKNDNLTSADRRKKNL